MLQRGLRRGLQWAVFAALSLQSRSCEQAISNAEPAAIGIQDHFHCITQRWVAAAAAFGEVCWDWLHSVQSRSAGEVSILHGSSRKACCCGEKADEEDNQEKALPWLCVRTTCSPVLFHFQFACCLHQWWKADFKEELLKSPASSVCPVRVSIGRGGASLGCQENVCSSAQFSFGL